MKCRPATDCYRQLIWRRERYRELREHWLRIQGESTVHRANGVDLWCDKRLSGSEVQSTKG